MLHFVYGLKTKIAITLNARLSHFLNNFFVPGNFKITHRSVNLKYSFDQRNQIYLAFY
jgi:hypothetical protein